MQIDSNGFQNKPPSLEEGPTKYRAIEDQNYIFKRLERSSKYQRCMDVIKVILYLELVLFVGWIGCIILTNYYGSISPYRIDKIPDNNIEFTNDFHTDDFSINSKIPDFETNSNNPEFYNDDEEIPTTEKSETSSTSIVADDEIPMETTTFASQIETEQSIEDMPLWKWFEKMHIPIAEDDFIDRSLENEKTTQNFQPTIDHYLIDLADSGESMENTDLMSDVEVFSTKKNVPFPIPTWLEKSKIDEGLFSDDDSMKGQPDVRSESISFADLEKSSTSSPDSEETPWRTDMDYMENYGPKKMLVIEKSPFGGDSVPIITTVQKHYPSGDVYFDKSWTSSPISAESQLPNFFHKYQSQKIVTNFPLDADSAPEVDSSYEDYSSGPDNSWTVRDKRSTDSSSSSSSSSSEEKNDEKKDEKDKSSSSSSSSSSEDKTDKDCSRVSYYTEDGEKIVDGPTNVDSLVDKIMKLHAEKSKPDCGDRKVIIAVTDCGKLSYVCSSVKISDDSSEEDVISLSP